MKIAVHSLSFECPHCKGALRATFKKRDLKKKEVVPILVEKI